MRLDTSGPNGLFPFDPPDTQIAITLKPFTSGLSFKCDEAALAYILPYKPEIASRISYQSDKKPHLSDQIEALSPSQIDEITNTDYKNSLDLDLLRTIYAILFRYCETASPKEANQVWSISLPNLLRSLGAKPNRSNTQFLELYSKLEKLQNAAGVILDVNKNKSYYAIIEKLSYDESNNVVTFSAPYLIELMRTILSAAIKKDKNGKPCLKKDGTPKRNPSHSFLIKTTIAKEKNKAAVENVNLIVMLIEQAGNTLPNISARTLIERNPILIQQLENNIQKNRQRELERCFKKTLELLRTQTRLYEKYSNIQLPDPNDLCNLPHIKAINTTVYKFPHDGKTSHSKSIDTIATCQQVESDCQHVVPDYNEWEGICQQAEKRRRPRT